MSTLTDDECARIKSECLDHVLATGANPYITTKYVYDLIRDNVVSSSVAPTTSSTAVSTPGAAVLTLASITGFTAGQRVVLDDDDARETVTIRAVAGNTISVVCRYAHAGTYRVQVESPVTIVRGILSDLITTEQGERSQFLTAGIKRADEVEFFGRGEGSVSDVMAERRARLRDQLARTCGISWILNEGRAYERGPSSFEQY